MAHTEPEKYSFFLNSLLSSTEGVESISFFFFVIKTDFNKVTHITVNLEEIYLQSVLHREKKPEAEEHFSRYLEAASRGQNDLELGT